MNTQSSWKRWAVGGAAALALTAGAIWTVDQVSAADVVSNVSNFAQSQGIMTPQLAQWSELQQGNGGPRGGRGMDGPGLMGRQGWFGEDQATYLADALGITVEELEAAQVSARDAAIDQAVTDGKLTQEQADQLKEGDRPAMPFFGGNNADHEALLADALGITVAELDAAKAEAQAAALAQAVTDGDLTQEEADLLTARQAFNVYQQEQRQAELAAALEQAVTDGALTQEQADLLLENLKNGFGPGMRGGFGMGDFGPGMRGNDGPGMRGDFGGDRGHGRGPGAPDRQQQPDDSQTTPESETTPQSQSFSSL